MPPIPTALRQGETFAEFPATTSGVRTGGALCPSQFLLPSRIAAPSTFAMRRHYRSILHPRLDVAVAIVVIGLGCYLAYCGSSRVIGPLAIAAGAVLLMIVSFAWFLLPRHLYASQPKLKQGYRLVFSDTEILFRTAGIESKLDWSIYEKWLADDEFYILYYGKRSLTIIPRRAFPDDSADRAFQELVGRKIGSSSLVPSRRRCSSFSAS